MRSMPVVAGTVLAGAMLLLSACDAAQMLPKYGVGGDDFDRFAGCWTNGIGEVDDTLCFSRGSSGVRISYSEAATRLTCQGLGRARIDSGVLVIEQPRTLAGCSDGNDFISQKFECDLSSATVDTMLCIMSYTAADGVDYEYATAFIRS